MDKLHVIAQLLEVPDVTITNFTNDKVVLAPLGGCTGFEAATRVGRRAAPAWDWGDGDTGVVGF